MHAGIKQSQMDLDFTKRNLDVLIALFSYGEKNMIVHNKSRALSCIDQIIESMNDTKELIESFDNMK